MTILKLINPRRLLMTLIIFTLLAACTNVPQLPPTAIVIVVTPTLPPTPVIIVVTASPTFAPAVNVPPTNPPPAPGTTQQPAQPTQPSTASTQAPTATSAPPSTLLPRPTNTPLISSVIPTPSSNNIQAVFGPHQNGFFIYLSDRKEIWAFMGQGAAPAATPVQTTATPTPIPNGPWLKFADPFVPGDPDYDPAFPSPLGLLQPKGGFGKVWRANATVRTALGWATEWERAYITNITDFYTRSGDKLILQHLITVQNGTNYLVDESKGTWEIRR